MYVVPGPCSIKFNGIDLGSTKSGIIIRPNTSLIPFTADALGAAPASFIFGGKSCTLEVIGMTASVLQAANIWNGNALQNGTSIGSLASAAAKVLTVTERDGTSQWIADLAFPTDPQSLMLKSTQELGLPLMFVIIPSNGKLFSTLPSYIAA